MHLVKSRGPKALPSRRAGSFPAKSGKPGDLAPGLRPFAVSERGCYFRWLRCGGQWLDLDSGFENDDAGTRPGDKNGPTSCRAARATRLLAVCGAIQFGWPFLVPSIARPLVRFRFPGASGIIPSSPRLSSLCLRPGSVFVRRGLRQLGAVHHLNNSIVIGRASKGAKAGTSRVGRLASTAQPWAGSARRRSGLPITLQLLRCARSAREKRASALRWPF